MIGSLPLWIAVTAGGLAVVNPCAFPLLPAFLSFYLGVDDERLPRAPTRVAQGLLVRALIASGARIMGGVDALERDFIALVKAR